MRSEAQLNPHVSVDCVIFGFDGDSLKVLLIDRQDPVHEKMYALPGNLIRDDEDLDEAAARVLKELTNLEKIYLQQFYAFGHPDRVRGEADAAWLRWIRAEPEARVITIAYYSLVKIDDYQPQPASFARNVEWVPVKQVGRLAFDHNLILDKALERLKIDVCRHPVGFELLPGKFTLGQLQRLYEVILNQPIDKRNFRRKILKMDILIPLDEKQRHVSHKPARLYRFDKKRYQQLKKEGFSFVI